MQPRVYTLRAFKLASALARVLPRSFARALGQTVAGAVYLRRPEAQKALAENLRKVTGCGSPELDRLCRANVANFGRMLADYFRCAAGCESAELLAQWEGLEHLQAARAAGKGVILVTAHLGHWELGGLLLAQRGLPVTVVTLEEPESALTQWRDAQRQKAGLKTIAVGPGHPFSFVEIVQTLRRNELVAMLVDRPHAGSGIPVKFFDRPTEFSTGPGLLWQHTGAAVVPAFVFGSAGSRYTAIAEAPLDFTRDADPQADLARNTQTLASHFENVIRKHPDQWFNYVPIWPNEA